MRDLKYLIVHPINQPDYKVAILFNGLVSHVSIQPQGFKTVSGGFCMVKGTTLGNLMVTCYGNASSIKGIESNPEQDEPIVQGTLNRELLLI